MEINHIYLSILARYLFWYSAAFWHLSFQSINLHITNLFENKDKDIISNLGELSWVI